MLEIRFNSESERRRFGAALLLSIVIMATGLGWSLQIGTRANSVDHALYHEKEHLTMLRGLHASSANPSGIRVSSAGGEK